MKLPSFKDRLESWAVIRFRMIWETEAYLDDALRHPERHLRIPAIPVGAGRFPRGLADRFWSQILASS